MKSQMKTRTKTQTEKRRSKFVEEKQSWRVENCLKVIFLDEKIRVGQSSDAGTFFWCCSNEIYKDNGLKKTSKFPRSFMI